MGSITFAPVALSQFKRKDGSQYARIRVTFNRKTRYIITNILLQPDQLTRSFKIKDKEVLYNLEQVIRRMRATASEINLFMLEDMDVDDVVEFITKEQGKAFTLDFPSFARGVIAQKGAGARNYGSALSSFNTFLGRETYDISLITSSVMANYEDWLNQRHGKGARAVSLYTQSIAHLHGLARRQYNDEELDVVNIRNPFAKYTPPTQTTGGHRNAPPAIIDLMLYYRETLTGRERLGVDVFLLSFAMMGANIPDLYECGKASGGIVTYERHKTRDRRQDKALMKVRIEPQTAWLFKEYEGKKGLFSFAERYCSYVELGRAVNIGLHEFEKRLGLSMPLTTYVARHTWATVARSSMCDIDKSVVNDCICHVEQGMRVTDIYAEKDWSVIWDANAKVQRLFSWEKSNF